MTRIGWKKRTDSLRQGLASIRSRASIDSTKFQELRRQAECCKVQFLAHHLEARRKSFARRRGVASVIKGGKGLRAALGFTATTSIVTGIMTKDGSATAGAGLSSLNGVLQGLGETDWAVYLGEHLVVTPSVDITPGQGWFTLDSVKAAMCELEQRAQNGASLGNLDAVISELQKGRRLVRVIKARIRIKGAPK